MLCDAGPGTVTPDTQLHASQLINTIVCRLKNHTNDLGMHTRDPELGLSSLTDGDCFIHQALTLMVTVFYPGLSLFQCWLTPLTPTAGNYSYPRDLWQGSDKCRSITATQWQSYWLRFPCSPWGQSTWKSGGNVSTIFWQVGSVIQIANDSAKWVFMGRIKPVRRKRGAWTKSDRCTGEVEIQKLFAFVVIRQTHIRTCTESLLHSNLQILAISVTILVMRGVNSF